MCPIPIIAHPRESITIEYVVIDTIIMIILQSVCVTSGFAYLYIDNATGQLEQYVVLYFFVQSFLNAAT